MTNLPILTSSPQPAAVSKQTAANATENSDAQNSQPFGEVLARQIATPAAKDAKQDSKVDDKLAIDLLAQGITDTANLKADAIDGKDIKIGKDGKKDAADISPDAADAKNAAGATDAAIALPADMLAAIMPHAANMANTATNAKAKADGSPIDTGKSAQGNNGIAAMRGAMQTEATVMPQAAAAPAQTGEQSFAAALVASNRLSSGMESAIAAREKDVAAIGLQASATALASMQNSANLAAPTTQPVQLTISTPVSENKWGDELGQKITWLASSKQDQTAELHLNPPQLGPLDVVIKVSGDQATAQFTSPHAAVREAIEQAMPKLRDMLADNGIMLGNTTVSDQTPRDQGQPESQRSPRDAETASRDTPISGNSAARVSQISRHNGIVDTFA